MIVRRNILKNNRYEIILVRRRISYDFDNFVLGHYDIDDTRAVTSMMNRMTLNEKLLIMSNNFEALWYHLFLCNPQTGMDLRDQFPPLRRWEECSCYTHDYYRQSEKKYREFMSRQDLLDIVTEARSCDPIWEIPKGRTKSKNERNLTCAIREVKEETGLTQEHYDLVMQGQTPELPSITISYIADDGIRYNNIFFIAMMSYEQSGRNANLGPLVKNICQVMEIDQIKWVADSELETLVGDNRQNLYRLTNIFSKTIQQLKQLKRK